MTKAPDRICLSCGCELRAPREVREVIVGNRTHGPLCVLCAQPLLDGMPYDRWLDEQWQRQRPN